MVPWRSQHHRPYIGGVCTCHARHDRRHQFHGRGGARRVSVFQPMSGGRAHKSGRCGVDLPVDPGVPGRTLEAPPPPLNK